MKRIAAAVGMAFLASLPAQAAGKPYTALGFGAWRGNFHQEGFGQTSPTTLTTIGPALLIQAGIEFQAFSVEYNATWLASHGLGIGSVDDPYPNQAGYYSLLGLTVGVDAIPLVRPHFGVELGNFGFSSGSAPDYSGTTIKAGIDLILSPGGRNSFALIGEVSKLFVTSDDAGSLPNGVSTNVVTALLGLKFTFGGQN